MRIAILGGAGNMGSWLIRHFSEQSHSLTISDPKDPKLNDLPSSCDIEVVSDNESAVNNAKIVFVSVPLNKTVAVIREVVPHMKENSVLCEISSLKDRLVNVLEDSANYGLRPLSIHPMFGPGARSLRKKILLIPIIDSEKEQRLAESLFPNAELITVDANRHDRLMALTLSLPYFMNMIVASVIVREDVQVLKRIGGTTFEIQSILTGSIMSQSVDLHYSLHKSNSQAMDVLRDLSDRIDSTLTYLIDGNENGFKQFYERIRNSFEESTDLANAYQDMYRILECLDSENRSEVTG
jgi:prephenate dehydrogenase